MEPLNDALIQAATHRGIGSHRHDKSAGLGGCLTFRLGGEEYGIDMPRLQEIRSCEEPARIANASSFSKGEVKRNPEQVNAAPKMNTSMEASDVIGMASVAERTLVLMDIEVPMLSADMGLMDAHTSLQ